MTYRGRETSQQTSSTRKQRGNKAHDCSFPVTELASGRQLTNSEGRAGQLKNFLVGTKDFEMFALSNQLETVIGCLEVTWHQASKVLDAYPDPPAE